MLENEIMQKKVSIRSKLSLLNMQTFGHRLSSGVKLNNMKQQHLYTKAGVNHTRENYLTESIIDQKTSLK